MSTHAPELAGPPFGHQFTFKCSGCGTVIGVVTATADSPISAETILHESIYCSS